MLRGLLSANMRRRETELPRVSARTHLKDDDSLEKNESFVAELGAALDLQTEQTARRSKRAAGPIGRDGRGSAATESPNRRPRSGAIIAVPTSS